MSHFLKFYPEMTALSDGWVAQLRKLSPTTTTLSRRKVEQQLKACLEKNGLSQDEGAGINWEQCAVEMCRYLEKQGVLIQR